MARNKMLWLLVSGLLVFSLILASCGKAEPTTTPTTTGTTTPTTTPTTAQTTAPAWIPTTSPTTTAAPTSKETPKYGGVLTVAEQYDITRSFDPFRSVWQGEQRIRDTVLEALGIADRAKGPGGTKEYSLNGYYFSPGNTRGALAESWEVSADGITYTIHLRKGIHFQNKPPANGREVTAEDVKYCFDRRYGIGSGFTKVTTWNPRSGMDAMQEIIVKDKYTLVFKAKKFNFVSLILILNDYYNTIYPPEVIKTYGDMEDWHNVCGTGPYLLTDYVSGSIFRLTKNPDYWGTDELHPGYQLPYFDEIKELVIPDESTRMAAIRSGKADFVTYRPIDPITQEQLAKEMPDLQWGEVVNFGYAIAMQMDTAPFSDLKVRKALAMGSDVTEMLEMLPGKSERYISILNEAMGSALYTPFDKLPQNIQEIYTNNPTKAKQLLSEAGYPQGFTMEIVTSTLYSTDQLEILKNQWSKIGVKLNIVVKEDAIYTTMRQSPWAYPQAIVTDIGTPSYTTTFVRMITPERRMKYTDPSAEEQWAKIQSTVDEAQRNELMKKLNFYLMENVFYIPLTMTPNSYVVAQPWIKGYHGEFELAYHASGGIFARVWLGEK
ncbi:MAG: ABC transporter substrate-binding protein [Dehalococcoidales bacterium]|nr:ABC transporter substrate-binding protein [Dehalococcoidales bacterium]